MIESAPKARAAAGVSLQRPASTRSAMPAACQSRKNCSSAINLDRLHSETMTRAATVGAIIATALILAGCGSKSGETPPVSTKAVTTKAETTSAKPTASLPLSCLAAAGLSSVEKRGSGLWRGFSSEPFFVVIVQQFPTAAKARSVVKEADLVIGKAAGPYAVTGPSKRSDDKGLVDLVAECLNR
jgi:hypothetical protein